MAFNIESIKRSTQLPPRILVYGAPGVGKTTLAAKAPGVIFLPIEDGLGQLDVPAFPKPETFDDVIAAISTLVDEDHDYRTLVIDSADKLEPIIWDHVCETVPLEKGGKASRIEQHGYGKGYVHAVTEWRRLFRGLDALREDRGMNIVVIGHSEVKRFEAPDQDSYDRYQPRLQAKALAALVDWCDAVLFAHTKTTLVAADGGDRRRAIGTGERLLATERRPAHEAKNRYSMPDVVPMAWEQIEKFCMPKPAAPAVEKPAAKPAKKAKNEQTQPAAGEAAV